MAQWNGFILLFLLVLLIAAVALKRSYIVVLLGAPIIQQVRLIVITRIVKMQQQIVEIQKARITQLEKNENENT